MGREGERRSRDRAAGRVRSDFAVGTRRRGRRAVVVLAALGAATLAIALTAAAAEDGAASSSGAGCPKLILYFSRGSGQEGAGPLLGLARPGFALYRELRARYGAGNVGEVANAYPAVKIRFGLLGYRASVANGVNSAVRNIADLLDLCPRSYLVLGGFSQGAQVTRAALADLREAERSARIAAVVMFGDPYFDPRESAVTYFPSGARKRRGILLRLPGARAIPIAPVLAGGVFSWCHPADPICEGPIGFERHRHSNYDTDVPAVLRALAGRLAKVGIDPLSVYSVAGTCAVGLCAVAERSAPHSNAARVGAAREGQALELACQTHGDKVTGANGDSSDIWDRLSNGSFVPDFYVNTPGLGVPSPSIPAC